MNTTRNSACLAIKFTLITILLIKVWGLNLSYGQSDMESSQQTASGYFAANYTVLSPTLLADWISPGNKYFRTRFQVNPDQTRPTSTQINAARTEWEAFTQCQRWRIRIHHESLIKRKQSAADIWLYYVTFI